MHARSHLVHAFPSTEDVRLCPLDSSTMGGDRGRRPYSLPSSVTATTLGCETGFDPYDRGRVVRNALGPDRR